MSVQILLSTYNGERHLRPLLESLLAQDYPRLNIFIRDDGSRDSTPDLLREYASGSKNIEIVRGDHLGFVQSFSTLIAQASPTAQYFALCDQDDVWQPDKISRAVEFLSACPSKVPSLYCSRLAVVNENLKPLGYSDIPKKGLSFCNALVENQVRGCTVLFNKAARRLLSRLPPACVSHDWWIYLVVSALGTIIYDNEPRILYRRHAANVFGITGGTIDTWTNKIRQFMKTGNRKLIVKQVEEFKRIYGSLLPAEHRRVLERFLESRKQFWVRLAYALSCDVYRQTRVDQYILRARIALDRL
jgi:glycosyltransferase involved in cell wall biosynthesis